MPKRVYIEAADDFLFHVIGIASDERIWKLCWSINQHLGLNLVRHEPDSETSAAAEQASSPPHAPLFPIQKLGSRPWLKEYYEDIEAEGGLEYALFANEPTISPKIVRAFRYFLLIRSRKESSFDRTKVVQTLNNVDIILTAVDITEVENINNIIFWALIPSVEQKSWLPSDQRVLTKKHW